MEKKKVEFIESYIKIGNGDYEWSDNHGELVRCKDCIYWDNAVFCANHVCVKHSGPRIFATQAEWYCADGERKDSE